MSAYKPHELAALTFDSFRFSQGDVYIQPKLIEYVVARERDRISLDALAKAHEIAATRTARFIRRTDVHTVDPRPKGTRSEDHKTQMSGIVKMWDKALAEVDSDDTWLSVSVLRQGIATRDYKYLVERGGRPRTSEAKPTANELAHPFLSHMVHYGMLGNTTGHEIYDDLFDEVVKGLPQEWSWSVSSRDRQAKNPSASSYVGVLGTLVSHAADVHFQHYSNDYGQLTPEWREQLLVIPMREEHAA